MNINMTKSEQLVSDLANSLFDNKNLLISGGVGVGKTYIAEKVAYKLGAIEFDQFKSNKKKPQADKVNVNINIIPFSPTYSYEDFVVGIVADTKNEKLKFEYKDKIFLDTLKAASKSWELKDNKKFVLILDDINRCDLPNILGNVIMLMEPHGNKKYTLILKDGQEISIPPNLYIIATMNLSSDSAVNLDYGIRRRFYEYTIKSDLSYIERDEVISQEINMIYDNIQHIIKDNLNYSYNNTADAYQKYLIGHGYFSKNNYIKQIKYQVLPLVKQYCKEEILDKAAITAIERIENNLQCAYTKNIKLVDSNKIILSKTDITKELFIAEDSTHVPLINLVSRIKEQQLICDTDIENEILFSRKVLCRKSLEENGVDGTLYVLDSKVNNYKVGKRNAYKSKKIQDKIKIKEAFYCVAGEMQPKEYTTWDDSFLNNDYINRRQSTSPNSILFFIVFNYYNIIIRNYSDYLTKNKEDKNIEKLRDFAREELNTFINEYKNIHPESQNGEDNKNANRKVRELITTLKLLWSNKNSKINDNLVEGIYRMNSNNVYQEYKETMEELEINQMILQGPPGTSKTYSTNEFLKYIAGGVNDDELKKMQIDNYSTDEYCKFISENNGQVPKIAWDIVQFHPSYGYEDFVRGIEVSTSDSDNAIKYKTVNKILGKISNLANIAKENSQETKFYLVIDEINRANLATVFGELIYGLEYRNKSVATPYTINGNNKINLPDNLYIIGTMNTADKSIGGIDYAIRRRFLFFSLLPDSNIILNYQLSNTNRDEYSEVENQQYEINQKAYKLFNNISYLFSDENLNDEYYKEDVQIGHTYFLVQSEEQLYRRFRYQIIPILREYTKDGMFDFGQKDLNDGSWEEFTKCISGQIDLNDNEKIRNIYENLIQLDL